MMPVLIFLAVYLVGAYITTVVYAYKWGCDDDNDLYLILMTAALWPFILALDVFETAWCAIWCAIKYLARKFPKSTFAFGKTLYFASLPFRPIALGRLIRALLDKKGHNK